jgi:hypothetical protein
MDLQPKIAEALEEHLTVIQQLTEGCAQFAR